METATRPTTRPSSLPMLEACPRFEAAEAGEDADLGTRCHTVLWQLVRGEIIEAQLAVELEETTSAILYARDLLAVQSSTIGEIEQHFQLLDDNLDVVLEGTLDYVLSDQHLIIDLKFGRVWHDYSAQLRAYAAMVCQARGWAQCKYGILYARLRRFDVWEIDALRAVADTLALIEAVRRPDAAPIPCDYCSWCAKAPTCEALTTRALTVAAGREDWKLQTYHPSEITAPPEMAKALALARFMAKWAESVEFHAKRMAENEGLPGYKFQERTMRSITDIQRAFELSGLTPQEFVGCTSARLGDLEKAIATKEGVSAAAAKKRLGERLAEVLELRTTKSLVRERENNASV